MYEFMLQSKQSKIEQFNIFESALMQSAHTLNLRIKELREEMRLTQKQLAHNIGYSQSNIARWEMRIQDPSASAVVKLAKFFGVSTDYILGLID